MNAPRKIEPVGIVEIAERLDVSRATVDKWLRRRDTHTVPFPEPTWTVGNGPAWNWPVVWRWARATGRI